MAVNAMKLGAADFVQKPFDEGTLLEVIERALQDCHQRQQAASNDAEILKRFQSLTPREREILTMLVSGHANRAVAESLGISSKTVEVHRAHIMEKMNVSSFAELVADVVRSCALPGPSS